MLTQPQFIGLGHYSRTGKDSLANFIIEEAAALAPALVVERVAFADKLKQIACDLYGWAGVREAGYYDATEEGRAARDVVLPAIGMTPVELWVRLGTHAIRNQVLADTWVEYVLRSVGRNCGPKVVGVTESNGVVETTYGVDDRPLDAIIIPDVRFPNEIAALQRVGGLLIKVVRPGYAPRNTAADQALLGFGGWDLVVGGSGEMAELRDVGGVIAEWLAGIRKRPWQSREDRGRQDMVELAASSGSKSGCRPARVGDEPMSNVVSSASSTGGFGGYGGAAWDYHESLTP